MCGLAGLFDPRGLDLTATPATLRAMTDTLTHRGPDAGDIWLDAPAGIGLGHRRLSILDLSPAGAQPMTSRSGRWVIAFNGEIYNFADLRRELEASAATGFATGSWRGHSDTEVLLEAIDRWGLAATLPRLNGMFAFAIWDRQRRELSLARDPFGEKPLYYGWSNGIFLFGSELKALRSHPAFAPALDLEALAGYLRYGYVPQPRSIHKAAGKLPSGTWVTIAGTATPGEPPRPQPYWTVEQAIARGRSRPFEGSEDEAATALGELLSDSVRRMMVADVPLGAMLSGGIDSSTIVALMQAQSSTKVRTFSIGSREPGYDEATIAKDVARRLGTEHTELYVEPREALAVVPKLPALSDEPFADSSQIVTYLVSQMARREVTVALSGDAGDELFGGYNRYFHGPRLWSRLARIPHPLRSGASAAMTMLSPGAWNGLAGALGAGAPAEFRGGRAGERIHKLAGLVSARDESDFHQAMLSQWPSPGRVMQQSGRTEAAAVDCAMPAGLGSFSERAMYLDTCSYLQDDILVKVDRAAMGVSLEVRVPFLDPRVIEYAWSLPLAMKVGRDRGKLVLRRLLARHLPQEMFDRPKQGFAVPVGRWLRTSLRDWAESLLDERRLAADGLLDPAAVRTCWREHVSGQRDHEGRLWTILMLQAWLDEQRESVPAATPIQVPA